MADEERRRRARQNLGNNDAGEGISLGAIFGAVAVGVGAIAAIAAVTSSYVGQNTEKNDENRRRKTTLPTNTDYHEQPGSSITLDTSLTPSRNLNETSSNLLLEDYIIVTVDATPKRGGGIIRQHTDSTLFFYSIDFTEHFNFPQEPDKFEMVNAFLALYICDYLPSPFSWKKVLIKTDNNFYKTKRYTDPKDQEFFEDLKNHRYETAFQDARIQNDNDMKNANQLSRDGWANWKLEGYDDYSKFKIKSDKLISIFNDFKWKVPRKYHK